MHQKHLGARPQTARKLVIMKNEGQQNKSRIVSPTENQYYFLILFNTLRKVELDSTITGPMNVLL
jgi:hypothetical protein